MPRVVLAVPGAVLVDTASQGGAEVGGAVARRVERDHERPVLRVDQVVGTRRADLADLGGSCRRGERDRGGAPVDLEHHAVRIGEERAAERGKRLRQEGEALALPELRARPAAEAELAGSGPSTASAALVTNSMVLL